MGLQCFTSAFEVDSSGDLLNFYSVVKTEMSRLGDYLLIGGFLSANVLCMRYQQFLQFSQPQEMQLDKPTDSLASALLFSEQTL